MKKLACTISLTILMSIALGQSEVDSLRKLLSRSKSDTTRVTIFSELALKYAQSNSELAIKYAQEGLALARALKFKKGEADCLRRSGIILYQQGHYPEALDLFQQSLRISDSIDYLFGIGASCGHI